MKILFLNALYAPSFVGGAERSVQFLAEALVQSGHQAIVVSLTQERGVRTDQVNGVKVYRVGLRNLFWYFKDEKPAALRPLWHTLDADNPWMAREVTRILDTEHPDVVHTNTLIGFSASAWRAVKQRGLPLVHTLRDYYLLCPRSTMYRDGKNCETRCLECRIYTVPRRRLSEQVDAVVGNSRFILERHLRFGYFTTTPEKRVIFNAYQKEPTAPPSGKRSLPIRFGYLGRLDDTKGIEVLLDTAVQLPEGTWNLSVGGLGSSVYEHYLRSKYEALAIKFLGFVKPKDFYSSVDVLVVPSLWHEPLPRTVFEAYAHGVPVVGSNRGGIPELVEEGRTGFLFDPNREGDLATKMRRFIDEPEVINDMQPRCLEKSEGFAPENIIKQYLEVYAAVAGGVRS